MKSLLLIYCKVIHSILSLIQCVPFMAIARALQSLPTWSGLRSSLRGVTLWNFRILEDTVTASAANTAWSCYFTIQGVSYWLVAIYICIKMVSFGLMWSWKPNWGSLLPACLCNCSMDFTNHKGQNECDHPQQSIAHWFFSLYDSHKYWSSFFKQGGLLIYIS